MAFRAKAAARYVLAAAAAIVLPASIVAAASVSQHTDHSASRTALRSTVGGAGGASGGLPQPGPVMRPASVAPRGAFNRILSAQQAETAAQACASYATYAGWANTAPNDELVTASAICVAESGGRPTVYYCNSDRPGRLLPSGGLLGDV